MPKIEIISFSEMQQLETEGSHGFHGSPIPPERLDNYKGVPPQSLMPLHAPRNYNRAEGLHKPRQVERRLAAVSFYDILLPAAGRALWHRDNHETLAPVDCLSGFEEDESGVHLRATQALMNDTTERGRDITATLYAAPLSKLSRSPDHSPHDFWSEDPVQPEFATTIDGAYVPYLASLCVSGAIEIIPPFKPGFDNV